MGTTKVVTSQEEQAKVSAKESEKPKFFSFKWFLMFLSALAVWKYGPKECGAWTVSSYVTLLQVGVVNWINAKVPWLWPGIKAVGVKIAAFFAAVFEIVVGAFSP